MTIALVKQRVLHAFVLIVTITAIALGSLAVRAQDKSVVNVYTDGDTNISDWLAFE